MDDGEEPPRTGTARTGTDDKPDGMTWPDDDFRALAEDWIALWQSEITAYLSDPETQQAWGAMVALWAGAAQAMMRSMPPTSGFGPGFGFSGDPARAKRPKSTAGTDERRRATPPEPVQPEPVQPGHFRPGTAAPPGPAPAAAAPVARDDEIRRLEQRVAELERSLAEQDGKRGTAGKNRRTRRAGRPSS